uniref:Nucleoporin 160kDa n=1 Tax=Xenopus tropicalis TaxID=8364 RepID=A0A6I8QZ96_XENTR
MVQRAGGSTRGIMAASVNLERSYMELIGAERETSRRNFRDLSLRPDVSLVIGGPKYSDCAGGYCYNESGSLLSATRNRFIHWTSYADTLELVELSLDINLLNNAVRLKILNCSILPGGVHICETQNNIIVLILTNQTVHRLILPHPSRMYRSEIISDSHIQSIFTDIGKTNFHDPNNTYVIPAIPGRAPNSTASTAWLSSDGEALFALPSVSGGILVIKMPPRDMEGLVTIAELKQSSVMQRLLTGWMPSSIRGDPGPAHLPVSLAVHTLDHDSYLFALCQDHKLRMWSYKDQMCLMVADMLEYVPVSKDIRQTAGTGHKLRLAYSDTLEILYLGVYLHTPRQGQILRKGSGRVLDLSWEELKKEVTLTVEKEIQNAVVDYDVSQEEFRQINIENWCKFYTCCLQYQETLSRPLALVVHPNTNMVCLLRKGFLSFLAPCSSVEHLYLVPGEHLLTVDESVICDDVDGASDIVSLIQCLHMIADYITEDMAYQMESACCHPQSPERVAEQILEDLIANDIDNIMENIQNKLQDIRNPIQAISFLLQNMDYETNMDMEQSQHNVRLNLSTLYGSVTASSVVCQAIYKISATRFLICRDLLILQHLLLRLGDMALVGAGQLLHSQQELIPRAAQLLLSYYMIRWGSQCLACAVPVDLLESNLQHLSVLELSDSQVEKRRYTSGIQTIVELFFEDVGRKHFPQVFAHLFIQSGSSQVHRSLNWADLIHRITSYLLQLLWPSNPNFQFAECLMRNCQYTQLQEYVRLLLPWCQVNVGSCHFMLAQCYLVAGEGHKALDCFSQAASEVEREDFLEKLIRVEEGESVSPRLQYYNRVLRLLEDVGLPELVIQLATIAISEASDDWRSQAALRTRIFKHHLDMGHNSQAYDALTQIPDTSRQLDCLRQLVVVLCERSQLQDLVEFPYVNLHNEVVGIIESRARAVDLMTHNYYELLYAFHIYRHNYRKAGTVMFEYGMRLGREVRTLRGLQKQVNSYLACLNCLRLIRPEYAWIVQPVSGAVYERPGASPKRNYDGESSAVPSSSQIEILELRDLEKEYVLAQTRLTLAKHNPSTAAIAGSSAAEEMVALLVQAGLFDTAISLCQTFKLGLTSIFEGLACKCIRLQQGGEAAQAEAWEWLAANQLATVITTKESSATDEAWRLMISYLDKYESKNTLYHHCIINKLLSHGVPLPNWLINRYKAMDAAELLRLYLKYDLLEEAAELVLEYVDALLGKGHQYFGIQAPLSATSQLVWFPYSAIDHLRLALGENENNQHNQAILGKLQRKMDEYFQKLKKATDDYKKIVQKPVRA